MAKLLEILIQREGIDLVLVEGGTGDVSLDSLRRVAWKKVRQRVSEDFLRQGKITGEEYLQLASDYPFELWGVEDQSLYRQNLNVFLDGASRRENVSKALGQIESVLLSLTAATYPSGYRELERLRRDWNSGAGNLLAYIDMLRKNADQLKISTADLLQLANFEQKGNKSSFDGKAFFEEIKSLDSRLRKAMLSEKALKLWQLSEDFGILEHLFSFSLTSDQYTILVRDTSRFSSKRLASALESLGQDLNRYKKSFATINEELPSFLKFYELAGKRDEAFARNIQKILSEKHKSKVVLITGGFHSENLGRLLSERGVSRVLISPEISEVGKGVDAEYLKIMRAKSKSTLRAPATLGSPVYGELKVAMEREQAKELKAHIHRLIGFLDIDNFIHPQISEAVKRKSARSELRVELLVSIAGILNSFEFGTASPWITLGGAGILALSVVLAFFLVKRKRSALRRANAPAVQPANDAEVVPAHRNINDVKDARIKPSAVRVPTNDPSRALAEEGRRFFESSFPAAPQNKDLPQPSYELPMPIPVNAIPADLDAKGKVVFILREIVQGMETMDTTMRTHQKETAERALHRMFAENASLDPKRFRQHLEEDMRQFFGTIFEEMGKLTEMHQTPRNTHVSEEVEEAFPRLPRYVKALLTENPELTQDPEVIGLMGTITGKLGSKPPVAEDIEDHIKRTYLRLAGEREPKPTAIQLQAPMEKPKATAKIPGADPVKPEAKKPVDVRRIQGQMRDVQRMMERFEADLEGLRGEILKVDAEYKELQESMEEARRNNDLIVQEALSPSIEAYDNRLMQLRHNENEIQGRLRDVKAEEARLDNLLDEGEGSGARSELRAFLYLNIALPYLGIGLAALVVFYLLRSLVAIYRSGKISAANSARWPFSWKRIFSETVFLKADEKIDIFRGSEPPAGAFAGLGVLLGWVVGGWALYQAYHGWGWETTKVLFGSGDQAFTRGALLWVLEVVAAPITGAILSPLTAFLGAFAINSGRAIVRALQFPLGYERVLKLNFMNPSAYRKSFLRKAARFLSRVDKPTLESMLQSWIQRGEYEKLNALMEKNVWKTKHQNLVLLHKDISAFELAKKSLADLGSVRERESIQGFVDGWKNELDAKKVNGAAILKELVPDFIKSEKTVEAVMGWMTTLLADPITPWSSGFSKVKTYYALLKRFSDLKAETQKKYALSPQDMADLETHLEKWHQRIPAAERKVPGTSVSLTVEMLSMLISRADDKIWFFRLLEKTHGIGASFFVASQQKELIARLDRLINYEFLKSWILLAKNKTGEKGLFRVVLNKTQEETLRTEVEALETHLDKSGFEYSVALSSVFSKMKEMSGSEKIMLLRAFKNLNPAVYKKDVQAAARAFQLVADKDLLREKLAANNGSAKSIQEIEANLAIASVEDIQSLAGFYGVLMEKADVRAQGVLLGLAARAPPAVLPVFLKSRDHLTDYYLTYPDNRDYENLPKLADQYRQRYNGLYFLDNILLGFLTDPTKSPIARIEEARKTINGQILVRSGFPENVIHTWDGISVEELIRVVGDADLRKKNSSRTDFSEEETRKEGEAFLSKRAKHDVVKKALAKMGRHGLLSYWESSRPAFYLQFLEDTKGLDPDFFKPGEKVRVSYDGDTAPARRSGSLVPIKNPIQGMKDLIRALREQHPNIYENFIGPKRELLAGKPLDDFIDGKSLLSVAGQFRKKVVDWPLSDEERTEMTLRVYQVAFSGALQPVLGKGSAEEEARYWQDTLKAFQKASGLKRDSDLYRNVSAQLKKRIDELVEEAGAGRDGIVQFILTRGSISDFFRGEISEDCTAESWNLHFADTVGLPTDPAFLSFRLVENGKWLGNIYAIVLKDASGKFVFFLDNMPIRMSHSITGTQSKSNKLIQNFYHKMKVVLENAGFDYMVLAGDPSSREHIRTALKALGGTQDTKVTTKPGGFGGQSEFGVSKEYIQGLGALSSSISTAGTWLTLDNKAAREKKNNAELTALEKQIQAMEEERNRLAALKEEKAGRVNHLKTAASQSSKRATSQVLDDAAKKEELEAEKITNESRVLEEQMGTLRGRLAGIRRGSSSNSRSELRSAIALAQMYAGDDMTGFLFFAMLGVIVVVLLVAAFGGGGDDDWRDRHTPRTLDRHPDDYRYKPLPVRTAPEWTKHPLIVEVMDLFKLVLDSVSQEMRKLVPERIFFPVMGYGMGLSKQVINTLSIVRLVLGILKERGSLIPFLKEQNFYKNFKEESNALGLNPEFDAPGTVSAFELDNYDGSKTPFSLEMSDRVPDDLLRGDISRDCTGLGAHAAFYETIPQFLLDPGFMDLKLRMKGKWVGNVYVIAMKRDGKPVLVIDAVQLPPSFVMWPIRPALIAQKTVEEVTLWAQSQHFQAVYMSSFVSNFSYLNDHFDSKYKTRPIEVEKLGGFEHLKELGFWDTGVNRNQYIESFSPRWNAPLKIDVNSASHKLLLRPIWVPKTETEESVRSEVRTNKIWQLEGFSFEVSDSDLNSLRGDAHGIEKESQDVLSQILQSKELGAAESLRQVLPGAETTIRLRVHDETETRRVFEFIVKRPDGRRNFIVEMEHGNATFSPYSDDLNLVDTALMTARENGGGVDFLDIFKTFGDPPDPNLHEIPAFGTIYVRSVEIHGGKDPEAKAFDLTIKEHAAPSIRIMTKRKNEAEPGKHAKAKAAYDFNWKGEPYVLAVYSPHEELVNPETEKASESEPILEHAVTLRDQDELTSPVPEVVVSQTENEGTHQRQRTKRAKKASQTTATGGLVGLGAAFIQNILAKKREAMLKASISNIEKTGSEILARAQKSLRDVLDAKTPMELESLATSLARSAKSIDKGFAHIEEEASKYKAGSPERVEIDRIIREIKGRLEKLTEPKGPSRRRVKTAALPAPIPQESIVPSAPSGDEPELEMKASALREEISELERKRESLLQATGESESVQGSLRSLQDELVEIRRQYDEAKTEYNGVVTQKGEESRALGQIQEELRQGREAVTGLESRLSDLQEQERKKAELLAQIEDATQTLGSKTRSLEDITSRLQGLESESAEKGREISAVESETALKRQRLDEQRQEAERLLAELEGLRGNISVLSQSVESKQNDVAALEENKTRLLGETQSLEEKNRELAEATTWLEAERVEKAAADGALLEERRRAAELLQAEISELERKKDVLLQTAGESASVQDSLTARQNELSEIKRQYDAAKAEYDGVISQKGDETRALTLIQEELRQSREAAAELESRLSDLQEQERKKAGLLVQIEEATQTLAAKGLALEEMNMRLQGLDSEISGKAGAKGAIESEIALKRRDLEEMGRETERLLAELESLRGNIATLSQSVEGKQSEVAALEENKARLLGEAQSLEEKNRELEDTKASLEAERKAKSEAEGALSEEQRKATEALQGLKTVGERLRTTVAQLSEHETKIKGLDTELEGEKRKLVAAEESHAQTKAERDQLDADLTHISQERDVLEESLREARKAVKAVALPDAALDGRESLETLLEELPEDLWQLLARHFPGQKQSRFQLTVSSVANELVQAWTRSPFFRRVIKNLVLYRSQYKWFQKQPFYRDFKKEADGLGLKSDFDKPGEWARFNVPGDSRGYSLELSNRDAEYLLRGFLSGDCTNCGPGYVTGSFLGATASHITDPGFFNFKILRDGEWVGNVYAMALRSKNKPVLVIDAMQIPWRSASPLFLPYNLSESEFPIVTEKDAITLAQSVMGALAQYSEQTGFKELWLSSFVSNFSALKHYFYGAHREAFDRRVTAEAKIGRWNALLALGYEGHPYVESIGNPEARMVWDSSIADVRKPEKPKEEPVPVNPVKSAVDIKAVTRQIRENVMNSYENIISRGMEFIVRVPGAPVRWVAFDQSSNGWKVYEKTGGKIETYNLFDQESGVRQTGSTLNLSAAVAERGGKRIPIQRLMMLPPLKSGELQMHAEDGGAIFADKDGIKVEVFRKKGFIVDGARGAFFVHPGEDRGLETKENLSLPLGNQYDVLRGKYPGAGFILGWHTNPGGEAALHEDEEKEIERANADGFQLVASPKGISLVRYYKDAGAWKKTVVFTRKLTDDWATELEAVLTRHLEENENVSASGYQLKPGDRKLLDQAIKKGSKTNARNIKGDVQKILFDMLVSYGVEEDGLGAFVENSDFKLIVVDPKTPRNQRAPPMGIGVDLGRPGRDIYASFLMVPQKGEEGYNVTIYVGNGIYELAGEKERLEIIAHELYQAFRVASTQNPDEFPGAIDLEIKIDEENRSAQEWESRIPHEEREDLGLIGGVENRKDDHVRARAFARLVGAKATDGIGTTYTALLRNAWALTRRFSNMGLTAEHPENSGISRSDDPFRHAREPFGNVVSPPDLQKLFEMSAYVNENKDEEPVELLERKIADGKRVLLFNTNAPTPWILQDIRKIIEGLAEDGKLTTVYLDLPPSGQTLIDEFLRSGQSSEALVKAIIPRFPPFLPREFQRPDLYENILRAVYEHNLEAPNSQKIRVIAYYQGRRLPPFPGQGRVPQLAGNPGQLPPMGMYPEDEYPSEMPEMRNMPFGKGMSLPPLPLTPGVMDAFNAAGAEIQGNAQAVVLFVKPLDEVLPDGSATGPEVASFLQIDKYTGFGPEKPENQLAMYMSEQASPNQKTFVLPILPDAPFYEEQINPGLPGGMRFNDFNAYPDLILSTAGDGEDSNETVPEELTPEESTPRVPVYVRSEIRSLAAPQIQRRQDAIKELQLIGQPAVEPLLKALNSPSESQKLGVIQALGGIGDPQAIGPLNEAGKNKALREAVQKAVKEIRSRTKASPKSAKAPGRAAAIPAPSSIYGAFDERRSYVFVQALLRETPLAVDIDAETLISKVNGKVALSGWGFVEAIKALERRLPGELAEKIRIRVINLNPGLNAKEIQRALAISPELRGMIEITDVPVRNRAFKGLSAFLEKDALKIAAEKNKALWKDHLDILVKKPGANEVVDGRKLFLMALLHHAVGVRLSERLKIAAVKLLQELGGLSGGATGAFFNPESRSVLGLEFISQIDRANRLLASMA